MKIYDKIGQVIKIGDTIAYGHALGRCAALQLGRVLDIKVTYEKTQRRAGKNEAGVWQWEDWMEPQFRITVRGAHIEQCDAKAGIEGYQEDGTVKILRKGTLQFPDRTIVIDPDKVPKNVLRALDAAD